MKTAPILSNGSDIVTCGCDLGVKKTPRRHFFNGEKSYFSSLSFFIFSKWNTDCQIEEYKRSENASPALQTFSVSNPPLYSITGDVDQSHLHLHQDLQEYIFFWFASPFKQFFGNSCEDFGQDYFFVIHLPEFFALQDYNLSREDKEKMNEEYCPNFSKFFAPFFNYSCLPTSPKLEVIC
jgi:hypothetical protein